MAALNTDSLTVARERRDAMADANENAWDAALAELGNNPTLEVSKVCRYRSGPATGAGYWSPIQTS